MTGIYILSAARTAIGGFGGSLAGFAPHALAVEVAREAVTRAGVAPERIETTVFGHVIHTEPKDMYLSRLASIGAGAPEASVAMNVNRLCGSGLQAVVSVAQSLMLGEARVGLAGGAEVMSRSPYAMTTARWGQKMGDTAVLDMMTGALTCPFGTGHMGVTAENVATGAGISREDQDAFALESQSRAAEAIAAGRFDSQILPVEIASRKGVVQFARDEHPKPTTIEALAGLRPAFRKDGTVTAGNASGLNDGAAALVLAREDALDGAVPRARILGWAIAGVVPKVMGLGPVPAVQKLCARLGRTPQSFDLVESNEAFAAQAIAVNRALDLDPAQVNPNGGAIALGHPVGATGAIILTKALYELERTGDGTALVTMCIGGGQGIALAVERV
ncbi:beta-ketothiolase BktB [Pseudogemmobacter bohemicus]|uniref:beta-ketothiolase BktB n=1 Tax=Pseudogemmobacter bohemicus TaxID=2250708 RepID=UPI000DD3B0BD|nr:beta-ketothiolase BktB [Pseudogemmobacter bohemicus]